MKGPFRRARRSMGVRPPFVLRPAPRLLTIAPRGWIPSTQTHTGLSIDLTHSRAPSLSDSTHTNARQPAAQESGGGLGCSLVVRLARGHRDSSPLAWTTSSPARRPPRAPCPRPRSNGGHARPAKRPRSSATAPHPSVAGEYHRSSSGQGDWARFFPPWRSLRCLGAGRWAAPARVRLCTARHGNLTHPTTPPNTPTAAPASG